MFYKTNKKLLVSINVTILENTYILLSLKFRFFKLPIATTVIKV